MQYYGDVRQFNFEILSDYDFIIHLAAISNDPIWVLNLRRLQKI